MKKIKISVLYNQAKQNNTTLIFDNSMVNLIPEMVDEDGNTIDNDFITYYLNNYALFDRWIRNQHGLKLYSMYDEDLEDSTELESFKNDIAGITIVNMQEFAGDFAKATIKYKMQLGADLQVITEDEISARHSEDTYGEDVTENSYGAQSGTSTAAPRQTTTVNSDKTYESGGIQQVEQSRTDTIQITDSSTAAAHKDTITRDLRTDEHDSNSYKDTHTTTTYNDLDYYKNMAQFPEFEAVMKRILNKIIIETGVSYEY